MIEMFCTVFQVSRRSDSRESSELMIEVRLIEVSVGEGDVNPIYVFDRMDRMQYTLEAVKPAKQFRS